MTVERRTEKTWATCRRCGQPIPIGEGYMVHDDVWPFPPSAEYPGGGNLHVACLEAEIGRQLGPDDFTDCLLNVLPLLPLAQPRLPLDGDGRLLLAQRLTGLEYPYDLTLEQYDARKAAAWERYMAGKAVARR